MWAECTCFQMLSMLAYEVSTGVQRVNAWGNYKSCLLGARHLVHFLFEQCVFLTTKPPGVIWVV
jgi:hypothetical protein